MRIQHAKFMQGDCCFRGGVRHSFLRFEGMDFSAGVANFIVTFYLVLCFFVVFVIHLFLVLLFFETRVWVIFFWGISNRVSNARGPFLRNMV